MMLIKKEIFPKVKDNEAPDNAIKVDKLFETLSEMPSDFYSEERIDEPPQEREKTVRY